jgi:hypothetical protein
MHLCAAPRSTEWGQGPERGASRAPADLAERRVALNTRGYRRRDEGWEGRGGGRKKGPAHTSGLRGSRRNNKRSIDEIGEMTVRVRR